MRGRYVTLVVALAVALSGCADRDDATAGTKANSTVTDPGNPTLTTEDQGTDTPTYPRVYRGPGLYTLTVYRSGDDATFVCEREGDMELRLEADGTALFTYFAGVGVKLGVSEAECLDAPGNAWTGSYDASAGTFTIASPSDKIQDWDVGGSYDDQSAFGPARYEYATDLGANFLSDTVVITFDLPLNP